MADTMLLAISVLSFFGLIAAWVALPSTSEGSAEMARTSADA